MAEIKTGGPAFPVPGLQNDADFNGMTLRDYFAANALQTMSLSNNWSDNPLYWESVARSAYVCADAMLRAREVNHG